MGHNRATPRWGIPPFVCLALLLSLGAAPSFAGTVTWTGGVGDSFWGSAGNWSTGVLPASGDNVVIDGNPAVVSNVVFNLATGTINSVTVDTDDSLTLNPSTSLSLAAGGQNNGTLTNNGALTSGTIVFGSASGTLNNGAGAMLINNSGATLTNNAALNNGGTFTNNAGGALINNGIITNTGMLTNGGTLSNFGQVNNAGGTLTNNGTISGDTINNTAGTLTNNGTVSNVVINNSAALINNAGATLTNSPGFTLTNGGTLSNNGTLTNAASPTFGTGTLTNTGTLSNNGTINNAGALANAGTVQLNSGSAITGTGTYAQTAGTTQVNGLLQASQVNIQGGLLSGNGSITSNVTMGGTISPGSPGISPGILTINGNYTQTATGIFDSQIAGLLAGTGYDRLVVNGTASLNGTLDVTLLNGFVVTLGDSFILMTYNSETGTFSTVGLPAIGPSLAWTLSVEPTDLRLSVGSSAPPPPIPEPSTFVLLGTGLGSLLWWRRSKKRTG